MCWFLKCACFHQVKCFTLSSESFHLLLTIVIFARFSKSESFQRKTVNRFTCLQKCGFQCFSKSECFIRQSESFDCPVNRFNFRSELFHKYSFSTLNMNFSQTLIFYFILFENS